MNELRWKRILVISPHPDDESLGCGALILRARRAGAEVRVIYLTDGERNDLPQMYIERRLVIRDADRQRWAAMRRNEALAALEVLGVPPEAAVFLHLPDSRLGKLDAERRGAAVADLAKELTSFAPDLVVCSRHDDFHRDHQAAASLLDEAIALVGNRAPRFDRLAYRIHGFKRHDGVQFTIDLADEERTRKLEAIECHASQLALSRARFTAHASPQEIFFDPAVATSWRCSTVSRMTEVVIACWLFIVSN